MHDRYIYAADQRREGRHRDPAVRCADERLGHALPRVTQARAGLSTLQFPFIAPARSCMVTASVVPCVWVDPVCAMPGVRGHRLGAGVVRGGAARARRVLRQEGMNGCPRLVFVIVVRALWVYFVISMHD